jgi:hypothetical protein
VLPYPRLISDIARWICERDPRHGQGPPKLGFDLDGDLLAAVGFDFGRTLSSLTYVGTPFEFIAFGWQGGDALQYGHLVHAPELGESEFPVGSFSPADDAGVRWLGDDTRSGIQNLLSANLRIAEEDPDWGGSVDEYLGDDALVALCSRFALQMTAAADRVITEGGRSERRIVPPVPPGWRFEATQNGVGVLAPEASFARSPPLLAYDFQRDLEPFLERAGRYLDGGHPASALCQLYGVHHTASTSGDREALLLMRRCYESLGRPLMAERVATHLARCSTFSK